MIFFGKFLKNSRNKDKGVDKLVVMKSSLVAVKRIYKNVKKFHR